MTKAFKTLELSEMAERTDNVVMEYQGRIKNFKRLPEVKNSEGALSAQKIRILRNEIQTVGETNGILSLNLDNYVRAIELVNDERSKTAIGEEARRFLLNNIDAMILKLSEIKQRSI